MSNEKIIIGSSKDSNLSDGYRYDMVVATTQKSINATMKEYLYNLEAEEFISCYISEYDEKDESVSIVEKNYNEILKITNGIDLFSVPSNSKDRTKEQRDAINNAYQSGFLFAFKAKMGISDEMNPIDIPNIVELIESDKTSIANVNYKAFFDEFQIIEIKPVQGVPGKTIFINVGQDNDNPWIFNYKVKLNMKGTDFNSLPKDIQDKLKSVNEVTGKINTDTMFSIQQLYLDLNTTALQSIPDISEIDASDDAMRLIQNVFINKYFLKMKKDGDVIFGYTVQRNSYTQTQCIVEPTDFNFYISPYYSGSGKSDPSKQDIYTLNYLVMCDNHPMPDKIKDFTWNWVTQEESADIHGVMSISKNNIMNLLKDKFTPVLKNLVLKAYAKISVPNPVEMKWSFNLSHDNECNPKYNTQNISGNGEVMNYTYHNEDSSSDTFVPIWGNITLKYDMNSKIIVNGEKIQCITNLSSYLHLNVEGGVSEGTIYNHTLTSNIVLKVDAYGQLYFDASPLEDKDNGTNFEVSGWSKFVTFGTINDPINHIKQFVSERVENAKRSYDRNMKDVLKNSTNWVFPGGKTFTFKNPQFSKYQDLTVDIIYAKPEN